MSQAIGQKIIDAIVSGGLMHAESQSGGGVLVVWRENAAEQIGAVVSELAGAVVSLNGELAARERENESLRKMVWQLRERFAPECPKHKGSRMVLADGTEHYHDRKTPHWRCEVWVGGGVCGAIREIQR